MLINQKIFWTHIYLDIRSAGPALDGSEGFPMGLPSPLNV